jgi:AraC family transcriptional regulator
MEVRNAPMTVADTHGILVRPEHGARTSSDGLAWRSIYVSRQQERPYQASYDACAHHLLVVHLSGPARVERNLNGDRRCARISTGGLFVLPAGRDFGVALLEPLETVHLYVHGAIVKAAAQELCKGDPDAIEFVPRLGEHDSLIERMGRLLLTMMVEGHSDFFAEGAARTLAAHLVSHHSTARTAAAPRAGLHPRQLNAVVDLIEARMDEPLSIACLAGAAGLSPIHFARQFKRTTGKTPHQFLIEARVDRAKALLCGDNSIAEIAYQCGFSHQEHMTRLFGRHVGATPAAYRRSRLS